MTTQVQSHAHISCIINGFRLGGWAEVEQPVEFPALEDLVNVKIGASGIPYGTANTKGLGGPMMFYHIPNAESADWWINEYEYWKTALERGLPFREYNGHYQDLAQGRQTQMVRGFLLQAHHQSTAGMDYTGGIYFTRLRSNNAGARTVPEVVADL